MPLLQFGSRRIEVLDGKILGINISMDTKSTKI